MKRLVVPFLIALPALMLSPRVSSAADHYDMFEDKNPIGGQTERHHDIVDLFTFPNPEAPGHLVMVMNTHNRAHGSSSTLEAAKKLLGKADPASQFSDVIHYSFRVRTGAERDQGNEYRFTCTFDAEEEQTATCKAYRVTYDGDKGTASLVPGGITKVKVGDRKSGGAGADGNANPKMKAFAGLASDAFFGDAVGLLVLVKKRALAFAGTGSSTPTPLRKALNLTENTNDLSIVLEVDMKQLLGEGGSVFRVAAETATKKAK